ncbi:MAG TPA: 3-isopropylmalate dehydratase small subunit [bacterium]|nr:3-isopropylmalate dehydratase small subunit [bacterium]HPJ73041.1 3-isopropylmalate dehydratase small subunit [bacterium]HPQ67442.1 3-isopropylmalate dehydratase small subunit [bacterium]
MKIRGKIWVFGDDVNTDEIIAARYLIHTDAAELGSKLMEDIRPAFAETVSPGDIIVAGKNFGCGSSREHAPLSITGAGIAAVVAESFARIFYRNAFNTGLPIFELEGAGKLLAEGSEIEIDPTTGTVNDLSSGKSYRSSPIPPFMQELIARGGLIPYMKKHLAEERG